MVVQFIHGTMLYLASVESATSSATQQQLWVVQSTQCCMNTASMEPASFSTTMQYMVVLSVHSVTAQWYSVEPFTLLTMELK